LGAEKTEFKRGARFFLALSIRERQSVLIY